MGWIRIASADELPEAGGKPFEAGGRSLLVCKSAAGLFVIENRCSHQLAKLEGGKVKGPHIFCPLHGVRFDMRNGAPSGTLTDKPIAVFASETRNGELFADVGE